MRLEAFFTRGALAAGTTTAVMKAFFKILWDPSNANQRRMQLDVLPGKHSPEAFLVSFVWRKTNKKWKYQKINDNVVGFNRRSQPQKTVKQQASRLCCGLARDQLAL